MSKIKNNIKLLFIACVSALTLTNCGPKDDKVHIKIGMWPQSQQTQDISMFNAWKLRFEKDHPEYVIDAAPYTYDRATVASNAMAKTLPTIFQTYFTEPEMLINNKYIRDVTDLVKEVGYFDDMNTFMRETLTRDNKLYGVPRDGYGFGMLLNLKTLHNCGVIEGNPETHEYKIYEEDGTPLYPTTFEELKDWSVKVFENSGETVHGTMIYGANRQGGWLLSNLAWNFGAELEVEKNEKWQGNIATKEVIDTLEYVQDLKLNNCLPNGHAYTYNDWYSNITSKIAIAFCGSDVIKNATTQGSVDRRDIAFVPMPKGPDGRYSLYGGTPFVFANNATDEEVKGALLFLEYMGRSPKLTEVSKQAMVEGKEVSKRKNEPILQSIRPWTNKDFNDYSDQLDKEYVNVNMDYYKDFFNTIDDLKHEEPPYFAQELYDILDQAVSASLKNPTRSREEIENQLITLQAQFNKNFK